MINNLKMGYHKLKFYSGVIGLKRFILILKVSLSSLKLCFTGKVKFTEISGEIEITAPIRKV
jgi:2-keto-3-deoxy-6-phosphogluconate aldolase